MLLLASLGLLAVCLAGWVTIAAMRGTDEVSAQVAAEAIGSAMTEDQRIAWRKLRSEHGDCPLQVIGCLPPSKADEPFADANKDCWRCACLHAEGSIHTPADRVWGWTDAVYSIGNFRYKIDEGGKNQASEAAEARAGRPYVKAAVVVDLFSEESPRVLRWYWSDGEKVQSSDRAPNQQRQRSLSKFLESLMRHASRL